MKCIQCRKEIDSNAKFCVHCGATQPQIPATPGPAGKPPVSGQPPKKKPAKPKKKKNPLFIPITAAVLLTAALAAGVIFGYRAFSKDEEVVLGDLEEAQPYILLKDVPVYLDYEDQIEAGSDLKAGTTVLIHALLQDESMQTWGMLENATYILIEDGFYTNALPAVLDLDTEPVEKNMQINGMISVYPMPDKTLPVIETRTPEQSPLFVYETYTSQQDVYGRIGDGRWALIQEGEIFYASASPAADASQSENTTAPAEAEAALAEETPAPEVQPETTPDPGVDGYYPGSYVLNFDMTIRGSASYIGSEVDVLDAGTIVYIADLKKIADSSSIWGELDGPGSGRWICIQDTQYDYLSPL